MDSNNNNNTNTSNLIITIGPPACGKTTWLKQQQQTDSSLSIVDIALDDQPNVYVSLNTDDYLLVYDEYYQQQQRNSSTKTSATTEQNIRKRRLETTFLFKKSLWERLTAPKEAELIALVACLKGRISTDKLQSLLPNTEIHRLLVNVVKDVLQSQPSSIHQLLPPVIDLYVAESLFAGNVIAQTNQKLWGHAAAANNNNNNNTKQYSLAWGNTNTQPREYQAALEFAWKQRRPVVFCTFEPCESVSDESGNIYNNNHAAFDLHVDSFRTLLTRSVVRLVQTGRYVPAQTIWDMNERWKKNLLEIETKLRAQDLQDNIDAGDVIFNDKGNNTSTDTQHPLALVQRLSKLELHRHLANLAGYDMDSRRYVKPKQARTINSNNNARQQRAGRSDGRTGSKNPRSGGILSWFAKPSHDRPSVAGQRGGNPSQRMRIEGQRNTATGGSYYRGPTVSSGQSADSNRTNARSRDLEQNPKRKSD
jgi:hypothetical protein